MQWASKLFGMGLLDPELEKRLSEAQRQQMGSAALLDSGIAMLANSGYSRMPTSTGQALAAGLGAGRASFAGQAQGMQEQLAAQAKMQQEEQQRQSILAGLDPEIQRFAAGLSLPQLMDVAKQSAGEKAKAMNRAPKDKFRPLTADERRIYGIQPGETAQINDATNEVKKSGGQTINFNAGSGQALPDGLVPVNEAISLGLPFADQGVRYQRKDGQYKQVDAKRPEANTGGMNDRQTAGLRIRAENLIEYAAALTGTPASEIRKMRPNEVRELVLQKGRRTLQGPILGDLPLISEAANRDVTAWQSSAAAGQAGINNPTGPITNADVQTAERQVPGPHMTVETQARMIERALEELERLEAQSASPQIIPNSSAAQGGRYSQMSNEELLRALRGE